MNQKKVKLLRRKYKETTGKSLDKAVFSKDGVSLVQISQERALKKSYKILRGKGVAITK